ncbi:hypothetical protein GCM10009850_107100 [Nonomuraea monospora]|uniref:ATPase AAA-type core domain-containing protein n=1 Tax=Nonomuraea monospora TaxID=568818 RepID=A0ABN3D0D1_9ACTN
MRVTAARIANFKCFPDTGYVNLDQINVITGRNNSGKSAFIKALHLMQAGADITHRDVRLGATRSELEVRLDSIDSRHFDNIRSEGAAGTLHVEYSLRDRDQLVSTKPGLSVGGQDARGVDHIPQAEPYNFIYTYLSKRKVIAFDEMVDRARTTAVANDLRYLTSKVMRLANIDHPKSEEYTHLCREVLGFRVSTHGSAGGQQSGVAIGNHDYIPIESMGEGVSSLLGLITDLCMADGNLFLIEELENDIHPEGLKAILHAIIQKSTSNQFVISTHSNIVVKYLGAAPHSKIFAVESDFQPFQIPTSSIREIEPSAEARIDVLRQLGYELYDFDLWEGWLILEESTAEVIVKDYLIPWFAPRLSRIRTLAAGGTSKVEPTFEDFRRLFLFTHLEATYRHRAWVIVDGDEAGKRVIEELQTTYGATWPEEHFRTFSARDFELYYPAIFAAEVQHVLALPHDTKRDAKHALVRKVKKWCDKNDSQARIAFAESAAEVINLLRNIEHKISSQA